MLVDFRNNPLLNDLGCAYNPNLSIIYIKNGSMQFFGTNPPFVSQNDDWSNCPNLNYICANGLYKKIAVFFGAYRKNQQ